MSYRVFTRNWWRRNPEWPGGREPWPGRKYTLCKRVETAEEARAICERWNATHPPGFLSRKAEFEEN